MVIHILKDGTQLDDISGHVVKIADAAALYELMEHINRTENRKSKDDRSVYHD